MWFIRRRLAYCAAPARERARCRGDHGERNGFARAQQGWWPSDQYGAQERAQKEKRLDYSGRCESRQCGVAPRW
jgi:hypothetical protein